MRKLLPLFGALVGMASLASASVTYSFSGSYTNFNGSAVTPPVLAENVEISPSADDFTLTYNPLGAGGTSVSFPSNINFGEFQLTCTGICDGGQLTFPAFTFVITVTDSTDGAVGTFTGTSPGGSVSDNGGVTGGSNINITWSPLQLGPGTSGATSGSFGGTDFTINSPTSIVDPTTNGGITTIQGTINNASVPEPATLGMLGLGLLGIGFVARKRKA